MMKKSWFWGVLLMILVSFQALANELKAGPWRFELKTDHAIVPFIAELEWHKKKLTGKIHNGKEAIPLDHIIVRRDEIIIPVQNYEISMELKIVKPDLVEGFLIRHNKNPIIKMPLIGVHGATERFPGKKRHPSIKMDGKWSLLIMDDKEKVTAGVGTFHQDKNHFWGSILSTTGDYRYLEGYVSGDEFEAASFDGMYNYVFKGAVRNNRLEGAILTSYKLRVSGSPDAQAKLPDAYAQTQVTALEFSFPDLKGHTLSLHDKKFKGKPVIVQIFGSWCPNCLDEMNYFIPWYHENAKRGIEIVALAFERSLSPTEAKRQLLKVERRLKVPYTMLLAGSTSEDKPMDKLPGLKNFISFPTTIFLDREHKVVKVHAGFSGPSTGDFYEEWKREFNHQVNELLRRP